MLLKLLKLNANEAIISGVTLTRSSGNDTLRKTCQAPPPSTRAASVSSDGIDCSAPRQTRKKYGTVSQTRPMMTERRATHGLKSHGIWVWNTWLTTPKSSLSSPCHTSRARNAGTAYGMTSTARYVRMNSNPGLFNATARSSPSANETKTTAVAKKSVQISTVRNGSRISELRPIRLKLRRPTYVFQPGSMSSPFGATNEPRPLSLYTVPLLRRTNVVFLASKPKVGCSTTAESKPCGWIARSPPTGTL